VIIEDIIGLYVSMVVSRGFLVCLIIRGFVIA